MIPTTKEIANELVTLSRIRKTNKVSRLASELTYPALYTINALQYGHELGMFDYKRKKDMFTVSVDVGNNLRLSDNVERLREELLSLIAEANSRKVDVTIGEIQQMIPDMPDAHLKMAYESSPLLAMYTLTAPDDKESVYEFLTLTENLEHKWGKQNLKKKEK